ncbi:hypothetical protein LXL04_010016 [Taraxacum kok-saghyz]
MPKSSRRWTSGRRPRLRRCLLVCFLLPCSPSLSLITLSPSLNVLKRSRWCPIWWSLVDATDSSSRGNSHCRKVGGYVHQELEENNKHTMLLPPPPGYDSIRFDAYA